MYIETRKYLRQANPPGDDMDLGAGRGRQRGKRIDTGAVTP